MKPNENRSSCFCSHSGIKGALSILFIFLIVFVAAKIVVEIKSYGYIGRDVSSPNTISVSGKGEIFAKADIASFTFNVSEESANVSEAQAKATKKTNSIIEYLKKQNIEEKDIKTINYNIYPRYNYIKLPAVNKGTEPFPVRDNRVLVGYEVTHGIEVKIREIGKAGEILANIGAYSVSNVNGLSFSIDEEDKLRQSARELAIEDAKNNAQTLAGNLGVKLVRIINFSESGYYPIYREKFSAAADSLGTGVMPIPEIPTGENKITSQVNIVYEIR